MAEIKAVIFDQDGVIIDTERDGHRVAFNKTFAEFGFDVEWDVAYYHELLQIAGGKERMRHHLHTRGFGKPVDPAEEDDLIQSLHKRKTDIFIEMIEGGQLPLRPGVHRVMTEARQMGLTVGVCTTSNQRAAEAVTGKILSDIDFAFVHAGDVVRRKKPDPEIYELAKKTTGLTGEQCIVFEDSHNGVEAAKAAGMHVVCTVNPYTEAEDTSSADMVVSCLGDPEGPQAEFRRGGEGLDFDGVIRAAALVDYFGT
jgi:HAD superfamily hydrolase (TIGR01509 family)